MNTLFRYCLFILFSIRFPTSFVFAQQPPAGFTTATVGSNWVQPVGLTFTPDGRLVVWEKAGKIWLVENNNKSLMLDISEEVGNWKDHGLLGFALDPQFPTNGYVYLLYAVDRHHLINFGTSGYDPAANNYNNATIGRLARYTARVSDGTIEPTSRKVLLGESISTGIPILSTTHGVGSLVFGSDGTLMVSCGDGGNASTVDGGSTQDSYYRQGLDDNMISIPQNIGAFRAQQVDALSGKILRLDPATGDGVPSNPFFDSANPRSPRSRVWALGLRNPFRMVKRPDTGSVDPAQGNPGVFYLGDVGWDSREEMNVVNKAGLNFGWPLFEGFERNPAYNTIRRPNRFFPNPLYQQNGCNEPHYSFSDLLKQATLDPSASFTNNCNGAVNVLIPASIPQFFHTRPMFDWRTNRASRTGSFVGNDASVDLIGNGSPVEGSSFGGNCSVAGVWYTGTSFPSNYHNGYFHADYAQGWIRFFHIDGLDKPLKVDQFVDSGANVTAMAVDPTSGALYYVHLGTTTQEVQKISYAVNTVPAAVATADKTYGPGPLTVQFSGRDSSDPQGRSVSYEWDFGDHTTGSTEANPLHVFEASANTPVAYTVTLKVTNDLGKFSTAALRISVNNTPPSVAITSLASTTTYPMTADTTVAMTASVSDAEQGQAGLKYAWQVTLHHNNHVHKEPIDANPSTSASIAPVGCNGEEYYYSITLTVTDDLGLSASDQVILLPSCLPNFNVSNLSANAVNTRVVLDWNLPSQAVDEIMVVAKADKSIGKIPLQEDTSYTGNPSFSGNGTAFDGGKIVFKGQPISDLTVTDLSNGERYYFRVFSRVGNQWSTGSEINATPINATPSLVTLSFNANPVGLMINVDGQPRTTPYSFQTAAGVLIGLSTPSPQTLNGTSYTFSNWENGLGAGSTITVPDNNTTYTANFTANSTLRNSDTVIYPTNNLNYAYYEGTWNLLPDFSALTPIKTGKTSSFDISVRNQDDLFAFEFNGYVNVPVDGVYTFYTSSDDGSKLWIGSTLVVDNDGFHSLREHSGTIGLKAGYHAIRTAYFEKGGNNTLEVRYAGPGLNKQLIPASVLYTGSGSSLRNPDNLTNPTTGLNYAYYEGTWNLLPDFSALTPIKTGKTTSCNISERNRDDLFAFEFNGYVNVAADGVYTFYTSSDDGSKLWIGSTLVVDNDGLQASKQERSGTIGLKAGYHAIRTAYFERWGGQRLEVRYVGPGLSKQIIPSTALFTNSATGRMAYENLDEGANPEATVLVYPNPANDYITIRVYAENEREKTLDIFDVLSRNLSTTSHAVKVGLNDLSQYVGNLPNGLYSVIIGNGSHRIVRKIVIKK